MTLPPGTRLCGGELVFGSKGIRLTSDNTLEDTMVRTEDEVANLNDTSVEALGTLALRNGSGNVKTTGGEEMSLVKGVQTKLKNHLRAIVDTKVSDTPSPASLSDVLRIKQHLVDEFSKTAPP